MRDSHRADGPPSTYGHGLVLRVPPGKGRRSIAGATLLELLVVLAVIVLMAGIVVPNFERLTASVTRNAERDLILDQFAGLAAEAMLKGRDFVVLGTVVDDVDTRAQASTGRTVYPLDVPEGWDVELEQPLLVRGTGICLGGRVILRHDAIPPIEIDLVAPYCRVEAS